MTHPCFLLIICCGYQWRLGRVIKMAILSRSSGLENQKNVSNFLFRRVRKIAKSDY